MQIFFSFYQLKKKQKSNSKSNSVHQNGALVKIVDDFGHFGVADLCPWPELGDLTLHEEINNKGLLFQRSLRLAMSDLTARVANIKLVSTAAVKNHFLITRFENFEFDNAKASYKIKGQKNYKEFAEWLQQNVSRFATIRLDFNSCLTFTEFSEFVNSLSAEVLEKIEVVEDPCPFDLEKWNQLQKKINLAIDFEKGNWPHRIVKPTREEPSGAPLYFTSSMDHPVGIAHGLHFAQNYAEKTHGFLTLDIYEKNKYTAEFNQDDETLTYNSDGPGIGFTSLLLKENWIPQIDWENSFDSILLFNPQSEWRDLKNLFEIKREFVRSIQKDHILIPSSGSTQKPGDLKVLGFPKLSILQSAKRVVQEFNLTSDMTWGCVLPLFHVGGLGILARAHVAKAQVFFSSWTEFTVDFLVDHRIQLLSLVPTQVFDLVKKKIRAPKLLKHVFVGGASLDKAIEHEAVELGWPLVLTYGMTETASMIAAKQRNSDFKLFNGIEIFQKNDKFYVKTDSAATMQLKYSEGRLTTLNLLDQTLGALEVPDRLQFNSDGTFRILGRVDEQIKIHGELVNLGRLNAILPFDLRNNLEIVPLSDERKGFKLVLVGEQLSVEQLQQIANRFNQNVNKFEYIDFVATLKQFPRTALNKIKVAELKTLIEANGAYEKL